MIKAFSVCAIAAVLAAALTVLPGFAPDVKASSPGQSVATVKGDRLASQSQAAKIPCDQQSWPNVDASCLRRGDSAAVVQPVRMVTAGRN